MLVRNGSRSITRTCGVLLFPSFLQYQLPPRLRFTTITSIFTPSPRSYILSRSPLFSSRSQFSTISSRNKNSATTLHTQHQQQLQKEKGGRIEVELLHRAEKFMEEARRLFERGDVEGAIEWCSKAIEMAPNRLVSPYYLRAECWQRQSPPRYDRALSDYRRILQVFPEDPLLSWLGMAKCLSQLGDLEGAVQTYDKVLQLDPTYLPAIAERAEVLRSQREFQSALVAFDRLYQLSLAMEEKGKGVEGEGRRTLGYYEEKGLLGKAAVLLQVNEQEEAYEVYKELLRKEPNCSAAYCGLGLIHYHNSDLNSAIENYDRALELSQQPIVYHQRACALLDKQEYEKSLSDCHQALRLDPGLNTIQGGGGVQLTIAQCHEGLEQWEQAINAFSAYIDLHSSKNITSSPTYRPIRPLQFLALISVHLHRAHCSTNLLSALLSTSPPSAPLLDLVTRTLANLPNTPQEQLEDLLRVLMDWQQALWQRLDSVLITSKDDERLVSLLKRVVSDLTEGLKLGERHIEAHAERLQLSNEFQSQLNQLLCLLRNEQHNSDSF